jgi:gamma-glutamyltranspeptidase/glutathione hydrolase
MEPAIELAERGHGVGCITADKWAPAGPAAAGPAGLRPGLHAARPRALPGERFVFAEAGATLRKIAATQGEAFYRGEIAEPWWRMRRPTAAR